MIGGQTETYQRANNPYWADDSAADENENQIFDAASDDGEGQAASASEPEPAAAAVKPKILKTTPKPSGDEGLLKPDPDDD